MGSLHHVMVVGTRPVTHPIQTCTSEFKRFVFRVDRLFLVKEYIRKRLHVPFESVGRLGAILLPEIQLLSLSPIGVLFQSEIPALCRVL